jgi:hypothetical protein
MIQCLYSLWETERVQQLNERDYTTLAYELALRIPEQGKEILQTQRQRIHNPDRLRQFDFISRAMTADTLKLDSLFRSLLQAENRRIEPWAATTLSYLNHPTRQDYAVAAHVAAGFPVGRLVLGIPFYGHGTNEAPELLDYRHIIVLDSLQSCWDSAAQVPYMINSQGHVVVNYENAQSIAFKCQFLHQKGMLGGYVLGL